MIDPSGDGHEEATGAEASDRGRMGRRRFLGTGLAAAGATLIPSGAVAGAKARRVAGSEAAPQLRAPGPTLSAGGSIPQLPLRGVYPNLPAVPVDSVGALDTLEKLEVRGAQVEQAKQGLNHRFTINGVTNRAYAFLFGGGAGAASRDARRALAKSLRENPGRAARYLAPQRDPSSSARAAGGAQSLERPGQFSISWTSFPNVYKTGLRRLPAWRSSLSDADSATRQFWPMIAGHGTGYNLIVPEKVTASRARALRREFGKAWSPQVNRAQRAGRLYAIDMSRFESLQPQTAGSSTRFTPATITLMTQSTRTKAMTPVAVFVSGYQGTGRTVFARSTATDGAWLYALQAAKASITVFGIWLGHVYHWHLVTAAMQMTMFNTLPATHPIYQLLAPQSQYAISFDNVLLTLWSDIAPPTSLTTPDQFLALSNDYGAGRKYFDDDPKTTLKQLGLRQRDFSIGEAWDRYPVVGRLLTIWNLVENYVETFVKTTYASDAAVSADGDLQAWIAAAASTDASTGGNIRGLPEMNSRASLQKVLTSLIYRITVHGVSRLSSTSNPELTFVPNFPQTLQRSDIPSPRARISTRKLLTYLPNTDTISQAVTFYFTFTFSTPYEPYIPLDGVGTDLFFPGGLADKRNRALVNLRNGLASFIDDYQPDLPERFQWPLNIET